MCPTLPYRRLRTPIRRRSRGKGGGVVCPCTLTCSHTCVYVCLNLMFLWWRHRSIGGSREPDYIHCQDGLNEVPYLCPVFLREDNENPLLTSQPSPVLRDPVQHKPGYEHRRHPLVVLCTFEPESEGFQLTRTRNRHFTPTNRNY